MTKGHLFIWTVLCLGTLLVFNAFLALRMDSVASLTLRQLRRQSQIDILFVGNSLMASGLDPQVFESAWPHARAPLRAFNAALGASCPVEHYLLAHEAFLHHDSIHYVVYGFFDFQLTSPSPYGWDDLVGNRSMAYSVEPDVAASLFAPRSQFIKWRFRLIGMIPMLRDHSQLWKFVEQFRRTLSEIGMPKAKSNEFGRIADFKDLAAPEPAAFERECDGDVVASAEIVRPVQELIHLARNAGARVIVVEMPVTSVHRSECYSSPAWRQYRGYLRAKLEKEGVSYLVASDWVKSDDDFSDGLHLNDLGAKIFSIRLAGTLSELIQPQ